MKRYTIDVEYSFCDLEGENPYPNFREDADDGEWVAYDDAKAAVEQARREGVPPCEWHDDEDGVWHTACDRSWEFTNDGPTENRMDYCMGCGGRVVVTALRGTDTTTP